MITPCSTTPWRINNTRRPYFTWRNGHSPIGILFLSLRSTSVSIFLAERVGEHECSCFPNFPVARGIRPSEGNRTPWRRRLADSVAPGQSAASPFRPDQCQGVNCAPGVWWPERGVGFHHPHDSFLITWQYSRPCSQHVCHHNYLHLACNSHMQRRVMQIVQWGSQTGERWREGVRSTFTAPCVAKLDLSKNSLERICENMTLTPRPAADCVTPPALCVCSSRITSDNFRRAGLWRSRGAYIYTQGERNSRACVCQTRKECCRLSVNRWCFSRRLLLLGEKNTPRTVWDYTPKDVIGSDNLATKYLSDSQKNARRMERELFHA